MYIRFILIHTYVLHADVTSNLKSNPNRQPLKLERFHSCLAILCKHWIELAHYFQRNFKLSVNVSCCYVGGAAQWHFIMDSLFFTQVSLSLHVLVELQPSSEATQGGVCDSFLSADVMGTWSSSSAGSVSIFLSSLIQRWWSQKTTSFFCSFFVLQ